MFLLTAISYILFFGDPMDIAVITQEMRQKRPFIATIYACFSQYIFSTIIILNTAYYCWIGRKLVKLLDDNCFYHAYCNVPTKLIFYSAFSLQMGSYFILSLINTITVLDKNHDESILILLANRLIIYPINAGMFFGFFATHYTQFGSKVILANIEAFLNGQSLVYKSM